TAGSGVSALRFSGQKGVMEGLSTPNTRLFSVFSRSGVTGFCSDQSVNGSWGNDVNSATAPDTAKVIKKKNRLCRITDKRGYFMKSALTFYWRAATGTLPTRVVIINGRSLQKPDFLTIAGKHSIHYPGDKRPKPRMMRQFLN